jgi:CRP-like cAMP-binding protein
MITRAELRRMVLMARMSDRQLDQILPLVEKRHYEERQYVFREGDPAEHFYILKQGKILLEQRLSEKLTVCMDAIKPGYSFGWSAMLVHDLEPYNSYTSDAISVEPSEVLAINGEEFKELLETDHTMAYLVHQRLNRVIKQRLVHRTEQFVRLIRQHPDISRLIQPC